MDIVEFVRQVPAFDSLSHSEKIKHFAWYLHFHRKQERFDRTAIRRCYEELHAEAPDIGIYIRRLSERSPAELLKDRAGYRLEGRARESLSKKYGQLQSTIVVSALLSELPTKVPSVAEQAFLKEALACYRVQAFRAAIVMSWNLAFDHVLHWVFCDATRLAAFNSAITIRFPKKAGVGINKREDFEELKEWEIIDILATANLIAGGVKKILKEKLDRRNTAAHPSTVVITEAQANDVITDLVNNVVLPFK